MDIFAQDHVSLGTITEKENNVFLLPRYGAVGLERWNWRETWNSLEKNDRNSVKRHNDPFFVFNDRLLNYDAKPLSFPSLEIPSLWFQLSKAIIETQPILQPLKQRSKWVLSFTCLVFKNALDFDSRVILSFRSPFLTLRFSLKIKFFYLIKYGL